MYEHFGVETANYIETAIRAVIDYCCDNNLRYYRSDFPPIVDGKLVVGEQGLNAINLDYDGGKPCGIDVILRFNNGRCGKHLKKVKDRFYNYVYARVLDIGVCFSFSFSELSLLSLKESGKGEDKADKIIAVIGKLLALADIEKNPSEAEAIAASLKAQTLLAKYNLDITDVTGEDKDEPIEQVIADVSKGKKWKYLLSAIVGRSYCCRVYRIGSEQIVFYGFRSDSLIARRVFMYLFKVGNRLARIHVKERLEHGECSGEGLFNSFCAGFVKGVGSELDKNCKALALVVPQKVKESYDVISKDFRIIKTTIPTVDKVAYNEGIIEGKRALNAQYIESNDFD